MRTLMLSLLFFPFAVLAQKTESYLKLNNTAGQLIKGNAVAKGFEKSITAQSFSSSGKNNTQLTFSMAVSPAAAELKTAMGSGSLLPNGTLTVTQAGNLGAPNILYIIKMENIKVNSCAESMGCNGAITTSTVITATRIGWTYYQADAAGKWTVSRKYGYDSETGKEWTNF